MKEPRFFRMSVSCRITWSWPKWRYLNSITAGAEQAQRQHEHRIAGVDRLQPVVAALVREDAVVVEAGHSRVGEWSAEAQGRLGGGLYKVDAICGSERNGSVICLLDTARFAPRTFVALLRQTCCGVMMDETRPT